jgi:hypothetical protein
MLQGKYKPSLYFRVAHTLSQWGVPGRIWHTTHGRPSKQTGHCWPWRMQPAMSRAHWYGMDL